MPLPPALSQNSASFTVTLMSAMLGSSFPSGNHTVHASFQRASMRSRSRTSADVPLRATNLRSLCSVTDTRVSPRISSALGDSFEVTNHRVFAPSISAIAIGRAWF